MLPQRYAIALWSRSHGASSMRRVTMLRRSFSADAQVATNTLGSSTAVQPRFGDAGGSSLAELSERAGYLPRPDAHDEQLKPGFRGGTKLFIFFLCNAVPIGALLYYLKKQSQERAEMSLLALPTSAEDVAAEALRAIRTSAVCFLLQPDELNAATAPSHRGGVLRVDPHTPEGSAYVPPTEPLPILPQLERNVLTDILESPPVAGLGFIHFALSRSSALGAALAAGDRQAKLLYVSHVRGAYCTVSGQVSILTDAESRRRYWKSAWVGSFVPDAPARTSPASLPSASPTARSKEEVAPPPWAVSDYLLIRLAVVEVALHGLVDGPDRWEQRSARRVDDGGSVAWKLI